jgi:hypothetical protein
MAWSEGAKYRLLQCASQELPAGSKHTVKLVYDAEAALGVFPDGVTHKSLVPNPETSSTPAEGATVDNATPPPLAEGEIVVIYDIGLFTAVGTVLPSLPTPLVVADKRVLEDDGVPGRLAEPQAKG